ncbi:hypothetical protein CKAH01_01521 [Colletotrichum kahawae]|uniref:2EXR domain-containing protein n=1 Tax=Colletotrichum kahawae TaxID=34407 RepID=A0AAD9Y7U8_COLKA|nr:hypothetical protein CKAH01_01521 [Colletotrichum kahawae]
MKQAESLPLFHGILLQRHRCLRNIITVYHEPRNVEVNISSVRNLANVAAQIQRCINQQNAFHRFRHLPVELQIEVWKWTLVEPQVYCFKNEDHERERLLCPKPRPALFVCALSRKIATENLYRMPQTMRGKDTRKDHGWVYVNPATDMFYNHFFHIASPNCPESWTKIASGPAIMKKIYPYLFTWLDGHQTIRMTKLEEEWFVEKG